MNTKKKAFEIVSLINNKETRLSSEKIELSMIDDIEQRSKELEDAWKKGQSVRAKALREAKSKVDAELKKMNSLRVETFKILETFESRAKDLGINTSSIPNVKKARKSLEVMDSRIKELSQGFDGNLM